MSPRIRRSRRLALLLATVAFLGVVIAIASCGDEDLVFPGDIPSTATPENTATPDNSEN